LSKKLVFFGLFLLCLASALPAWGRKEKTGTETIEAQKMILEKNIPDKPEAVETAFVQVTGIVRLVGGGLIPEIVITGPYREWYVSRADEHLLKELQHRTVTVEGFESVFELRFANGLYAGQRRILEDIKIISVE
jgi:hypothetical protein